MEDVFSYPHTPYSKMVADLCRYKLALVASFKIKYSMNFKLKNEASRAYLNKNKRIFKWRPFWNKVYSLLLQTINSFCALLMLFSSSRDNLLLFTGWFKTFLMS